MGVGRVGERRKNSGRPVETADWEEGLEVRPEELHEFLTADLSGVSADPEFKERLRAKLWQMVSSGQFKTEKPDN